VVNGTWTRDWSCRRARVAAEDREQDRLNLLSPRERQVAGLVVRGSSSSEIATLLELSSKTVDTYRSRLMTKLSVDDVPALVRFAIRAGLVDVDEARGQTHKHFSRFECPPRNEVENSLQTVDPARSYSATAHAVAVPGARAAQASPGSLKSWTDAMPAC
jgi:DNA-binding CsgD family transcriptional regulator